MKIIEKENGQIFEVCETQKEFLQSLRDNITYGGQMPDDCGLGIEYKDGTMFGAVEGDLLDYKKSGIKRAAFDCYGMTQIIFNCNIIYNERYEGYEVEEEI